MDISHAPGKSVFAVTGHDGATPLGAGHIPVDSDGLIHQEEEMVEAVGVEPTSETTIDREPSCFFQFAFVS